MTLFTQVVCAVVTGLFGGAVMLLSATLIEEAGARNEPLAGLGGATLFFIGLALVWASFMAIR